MTMDQRGLCNYLLCVLITLKVVSACFDGCCEPSCCGPSCCGLSCCGPSCCGPTCCGPSCSGLSCCGPCCSSPGCLPLPCPCCHGIRQLPLLKLATPQLAPSVPFAPRAPLSQLINAPSVWGGPQIQRPTPLWAPPQFQYPIKPWAPPRYFQFPALSSPQLPVQWSQNANIGTSSIYRPPYGPSIPPFYSANFPSIGFQTPFPPQKWHDWYCRTFCSDCCKSKCPSKPPCPPRSCCFFVCPNCGTRMKACSECPTTTKGHHSKSNQPLYYFFQKCKWGRHPKGTGSSTNCDSCTC